MRHDDEDTTYRYLLIVGIVALVAAFVLAWVMA
jgi:hypothetical protein